MNKKEVNYIRTPRGTFKVSNLTVDEARANGYAPHHWHGDYVIMAKNNQAIAVKKEASF